MSDDGKRRSFMRRVKRRVDVTFRPEDGSIIWLVRVTLEWIHELIAAVNSLIAVRQAQKHCDEALAEAQSQAENMETLHPALDIDDDRMKRIKSLSRKQARR